MTPEQLRSETGSGKFRPAYYFFGTEDYRIMEAEKYLAKQFMPDLQLATNYRRLDARKVPFAEVSAELSAYPMLGERLVVAISDIQKLTSDQLDRLGKLLTPADPNRLVIFTTPSVRMPRKDSAFVKRITAIAEDVEFKKLTASEVHRHIMSKLSKHGVSIEPKALDQLIEAVAGNRGAIEQETEKLVSFKGPGSAITTDDIRQLVGGYEVFVVYEIAKDIVTGDTKRVMVQLRALAADGNGPTSILFWISKYLIDLYLVKNGKPLDAKRRWLAYKYREYTGRIDNARLERMIVACARADADMRGSGVPPDVRLEMLVVELTKR